MTFDTPLEATEKRCACGALIASRYAWDRCTRCAIEQNRIENADYWKQKRAAAYERLRKGGLLRTPQPMEEDDAEDATLL